MKRLAIILVLLISMLVWVTPASAIIYGGWRGAYYRPYPYYYGYGPPAVYWGGYYGAPVYPYGSYYYGYPSGYAWGYPGAYYYGW